MVMQVSVLRREVAVQEWSRDGQRLAVLSAETVKTLQQSQQILKKFLPTTMLSETRCKMGEKKRHRKFTYFLTRSALTRPNHVSHFGSQNVHKGIDSQNDGNVRCALYGGTFRVMQGVNLKRYL